MKSKFSFAIQFSQDFGFHSRTLPHPLETQLVEIFSRSGKFRDLLSRS